MKVNRVDLVFNSIKNNTKSAKCPTRLELIVDAHLILEMIPTGETEQQFHLMTAVSYSWEMMFRLLNKQQVMNCLRLNINLN